MTQPLITCMGEILFDMLPIVENESTVGFRMHPGGSPFNVAMGTARLGQKTAFACKISTDLFGRMLRQTVEHEGIDTRFMPSDDAFTTLAFVAYEHGEPAYSFYGDGMADTRLTSSDVPQVLFDETKMLHIGSISLLRGSTPSAVLSTVERLHGKALIHFDPNLRPSLIKDETGYRALLDKLFKLADIIKISAADLKWLMPGRSVEAAANALKLHGAAMVVVTRGGDGALCLRGKDTLVSPVFEVNVVDTVGAGDAFSGGTLAALAERDVFTRAALETLPASALSEVLRFASATAAITCARAGANPPTRDEVMRFLGERG
jgi:fructokinase